MELDAKDIIDRYGWLFRLRPAVISNTLADLLVPNRRCVITTPYGFKLEVDPLTNLGFYMIRYGYEPDTAAMLRKWLRPGDIFLDVGANEGVWSVLAEQIVGSSGLAVAVEPQSRLQELFRRNMALNDLDNYRLFHNALGGNDGDQITLHLFPWMNNGGSGIVHRYRLGFRREQVAVISPETILARCGVSRFDFVKIDVEGFEGAVVSALANAMRTGRVRLLAVDYHARILRANAIEAGRIEQTVIDSGMIPVDPVSGELSGYRLYRPAH